MSKKRDKTNDITGAMTKPPAHAAAGPPKGLRGMLYVLTAVLIVIAGAVWLVGRDDDPDTIEALSSTTPSDTPSAEALTTDTADQPSTQVGAQPTAVVEADPEATGDKTEAEAEAEPAEAEAGAEGDREGEGPTPADPSAEIPDDAPSDVADVAAEIAAGQVPESRGIVLGGRMFLLGSVPTQQDADDIVALAGAILGPENVYNYYVVDGRAGDASAGNVRVDDPVLFETNSAIIAPDFEPLLAQAVALMTIRPDVTMTVVGHTDSDGPADYNQTLSVDRAVSVATWVSDRGVDVSRITTAGRGETEPIAANETEEGRQANRRIQVFFDNLLG